MTTNRDLLDREIGTPPPSTIDIDSLILRSRRQFRLRQAGIGISAAAMTIAVGGVLVWAPRVGHAPDQMQIGSTPTKTASQPAPDPRREEAARLTTALKALIDQTLPGATFAKVPPSPGEQPGDPLVFVDHGTYFLAAAVVTDSKGTGTISVSVGKEDTQFRSDRACMEGPYPLDVKYTCEVKPGADGATIEQSTSEIGDNHYRRFYIELIRRDDNAVSVDVTNGVMPDNDNPYTASRPEPVLSLAQALALVQEPSLATTLP